MVYDINRAQQLLEQLRQQFLAEMPERCDRLEGLVLALEMPGRMQQAFEDIFRTVHHLKGAGSAHRIPVISMICHHFEDRLNDLGSDLFGINAERIGPLFEYIDLLRRTVQIAGGRTPDFSAIENALETLRSRGAQRQATLMLVESSTLVSAMCQKALNDLPVQVVAVDDGMSALERLLREPFDILVTSGEIRSLNADALVSALRASDSVNRNCKIVMITADGHSSVVARKGPDRVLKKDQHMPVNLQHIVQSLLKGF